MSKQIKSAIISAVVTFVTFTILGPAGFGINLGVSAAAATAISFVSTLVLSVVGKMTSKGRKLWF